MSNEREKVLPFTVDVTLLLVIIREQVYHFPALHGYIFEYPRCLVLNVRAGVDFCSGFTSLFPFRKIIMGRKEVCYEKIKSHRSKVDKIT